MYLSGLPLIRVLSYYDDRDFRTSARPTVAVRSDADQSTPPAVRKNGVSSCYNRPSYRYESCRTTIAARSDEDHRIIPVQIRERRNDARRLRGLFAFHRIRILSCLGRRRIGRGLVSFLRTRYSGAAIQRCAVLRDFGMQSGHLFHGFS